MVVDQYGDGRGPIIIKPGVVPRVRLSTASRALWARARGQGRNALLLPEDHEWSIAPELMALTRVMQVLSDS
jgi:hypothetical protein